MVRRLPKQLEETCSSLRVMEIHENRTKQDCLVKGFEYACIRLLPLIANSREALEYYVGMMTVAPKAVKVLEMIEKELGE